MLRMREIRRKKGLSLRALSEASRVSLATVVRLEAAVSNPRLSTMRKLARALGVTVDKLNEGRRRMKDTKDIDWAREATEVSREVKRDLAEVWKTYEDRLRNTMHGYDFEELELLYKQLQLKLRNQQTSGY